MKKVLFLISCMCILALQGYSSGTKATDTAPKPTFMDDGSIEFGCKKVIPNRFGVITLVLDGGVAIKMEELFSLGPISWTNAKRFKNKTFKVDAVKKSATFKGELEINGKNAKYTLTTKLLANGLINVKSVLILPEDNIKVRYANMFMQCPFQSFADEKINVDGKQYKVDPELKSKGTIVNYKRHKNFFFFSDAPDMAYSIHCVKANISSVKRFKQQFRFVIFPLVSGNTRTIEFNINILKHSKESLKKRASYNGIDFWKSNRQHVPNYLLCKNLVQNPSFEGGLRYFTPNAFGGLPADPKYQYLYSVDKKVAAKGKQSLKIKVFKEIKSPTSLGTFVIPLKRGKTYTVSFYAKADVPGTFMRMYGYTCSHPTYLPFEKKRFKLTDKWERYSTTFKAPNSGGALHFCGLNNWKDANVWLDAIQLEEGDKLSAYTEKPVISQLVTSNKDNFVKYGTPVDAALKIVSKPGMKGKIKISAIDFFDKVLFEKQYNFLADNQGNARIKLPLNNLSRGIFNVRADFELANGFKDTDFFRVAIMDFLNGKHKNRRIFSNSLGYGPPRIDDIIQRFKHVGIGSMNKAKRAKYFIEEAEKNGIWYVGAPMVTQKWRKGDFVGTKEIFNLKALKPQDLTPEMLKRFENACADTVAAHPWVKNWFLMWEPDAGKYHNLSIKDLAKLCAAACRGMKKVSPQSKYIMPGTWNMSPGSGIAWQDNFLKETKKLGIKWDLADIHVYRTQPENPDLDSDTVSYMKMLKSHGLGDIKIIWSEGIYYPPYFIPEWNLSCYKGGASADHYYLTNPSYHMSWGEKIAAAFYARSWLVALKYADKVLSFEGFGRYNRFFMDAYLTPFALQKIPNTLSRFLGNADFRQDIRFAPNVRCYVFEDEGKRPVAAIWSYFHKVDRRQEKAPSVLIPFKNMKIKVFDLMEAPMCAKADVVGNWRLPASSFPIFIQGEKGSLNQFCAAINSALLDKKGLSPVQICSSANSVNQAVVTIINLLTKRFKGNVSIATSPGISERIVLNSNARKEIPVPLNPAISDKKLTEVKLPVSISPKNAKEKIKADTSFHAFAVNKTNKAFTIDGKLNDWTGIPFININNKQIKKLSARNKKKFPAGETFGGGKDHSAKFKMAWSKQYLYLAVVVTDDVFVAEDRGAVANRYSNDSLQIYIDTFGDAREKLSKGSDSNDYNYDFFPKKNGSVICYRRSNPERQLCGGLISGVVEPAVKTAFSLTGNGYVYEIAIPARYIIPVRLEKGFSCGFAITVNDHDGKYIKWARTLTPEGTGAYMNPHLFPVMILTD